MRDRLAEIIFDWDIFRRVPKGDLARYLHPSSLGPFTVTTTGKI